MDKLITSLPEATAAFAVVASIAAAGKEAASKNGKDSDSSSSSSSSSRRPTTKGGSSERREAIKQALRVLDLRADDFVAAQRAEAAAPPATSRRRSSSDSGESSGTGRSAARDFIWLRDVSPEDNTRGRCWFCGLTAPREGGSLDVAHIVPFAGRPLYDIPVPAFVVFNNNKVVTYTLNWAGNMILLCKQCHGEQGAGQRWLQSNGSTDHKKWTVRSLTNDPKRPDGVAVQFNPAANPAVLPNQQTADWMAVWAAKQRAASSSKRGRDGGGDGGPTKKSRTD